MKKTWIIAAIAALVLILTAIFLLIFNQPSSVPQEEPTIPYPTGVVGNYAEPDWDE